MPVAPSVASLPVCAPTTATLDTTGATATSANARYAFTSATELDPSNMMTAIDALGVGVELSVFKSNCGRPNTVTYAVAIGASQTSTNDTFGSLRVSSRPVAASGGSVPAVALSLPTPAYPGTTPSTTRIYRRWHYILPDVLGLQLQRRACLLLGLHEWLRDYDYNGGQDAMSFCIGFMEGDYCDGAQSINAYPWKVQNGRETLVVSTRWGAPPDPFLSTNVAKKVCKTAAKMTNPGIGPSFVPTGGSQSTAVPGCNKCTA
jgi:hypothetical protein